MKYKSTENSFGFLLGVDFFLTVERQDNKFIHSRNGPALILIFFILIQLIGQIELNIPLTMLLHLI
jgi:hypothetical protein